MSIQGMLYENFGLAGFITPGTVASEKFTHVIDMSKFHKALFTFMLGDMPAENITARVVTCDAGGTNVAPLKTATTLTGDLTANDNKQILIEVDGNDLADGGENADRYIKGGLTIGGAGGVAAAAVQVWSKHYPADKYANLASVVEIVK